MAFETAVRNPERYLGILSALKDFENTVLNDENLLDIVSYLYLMGEVASDEIQILETTRLKDIKNKVIQVNSTRKADGGFPEGYQSRFWTYMRTLSELGFVYAQYNEAFKLSEIAKLLINGRIDEQEAFSIQAIKYNRKSPYRNVSNDFNFFRFILELLFKLKEVNKSLSYEQFIVAMFSQDGNVDNFLLLISKNKFKDYKDVYNFVVKEYGAKNKTKTIIQEYPDVVRRLFIISGFISIKYSGKKLIQINENKIEYIQKLLAVEYAIEEEDKKSPQKYFFKLNERTDKYIELVKEFRKTDKIDGKEYSSKIFNIISQYNINEEVIIKSINSIGSKKSVIEEFKEIPDPLKLEFYISILIALKYGKDFFIRPNYKADHIGKPYSHAPGNSGDIEIYSSETYWLIEVTLIRNKTQQFNHETTSVIRHFISNEEFARHNTKYLSFIAPAIHEDTKEFYDISIIKNRKDGFKINIKPYSINDFISVTTKKENFKDMEGYTKNIFSEFKSNLTI